MDSIEVRWQPIPSHQQNGYLTGYVVRYWKEKDGSIINVNPTEHKILVDGYTWMAVIRGLNSNVQLKISVAGFTSTGEGPQSKEAIGSRCLINYFVNVCSLFTGTKKGQKSSEETPEFYELRICVFQ